VHVSYPVCLVAGEGESEVPSEGKWTREMAEDPGKSTQEKRTRNQAVLPLMEVFTGE